MRMTITRTLAAAATLAFCLTLGTSASALVNPSFTANKCTAGKIKCVIKKKSCLLNCNAKAAKKGLAVDSVCIQKCKDKFDGGAKGVVKACFNKLEAKGGCLTEGDLGAIELKTDAFVDDMVSDLWKTTAESARKCTAGKLKCVIKYNKCVLGLFAKAAGKGLSIDATKLPKCQAIIDGGTKGAAASCFGKLEGKGGCDTLNDSEPVAAKDNAYIDDLIAELQGAAIPNQRCTADTSVACTNAPGGTGGACTGLGTCEFYFGTPLPLSAGGVAACVTNQWNGIISGTANEDTGASTGGGAVIARVYTGITNDQPCPQCNGDKLPNDGIRDGTCSGGERNGQLCDANGTSPNPSFGTTSLDCPPLSGAQVGALPVDLTNTNTGTSTLALAAGSPTCDATGHTTFKCPCDVCSGNPTKPCRSNADCGGGEGTCDGAEFGQPTAINGCVDAVCSSTGECEAGPVDQTCHIQTQKSCLVDGDCTLPGDYCESYNRKCFPNFNGTIGQSITATGTHTTPENHMSEATFASTFCVPHTGSSAINQASGLPGPGRLQLRGYATDNGTDSACPTEFTFTPISTGSDLDTGWTGISFDSKLPNAGRVTVAVTGCAGAAPNCGVCNYTGPIMNH